MPSFATITLILTAALSTLTNAAPITLPSASIPGDLSSGKSEITDLTQEVDLPSFRRETEISVSVAVVFTDVFAQIRPLTDQLTYITSENATVASISPVVAQIKTQLTGAVSQLQGLVGKDSSVILAPVEGTTLMTVGSLATLIAGDLCLLFAALGAVLKVVVGDVHTEVLPLLADLGCTVTSLLEIVITLVAGIVTSLTPLLAPVVAILSSLGLTDLLSLLSLSL
ncbi:hypothetical protein AZE42_01552 [Rhizopogon vesiculosus]|uniref:Uncharacterized protein n=1 Tax=Rhizopogon vesiculosus TaxID=180088 RepID=A0A1J8PY61_9AGAM|nr:hypothetical protein AZE42_01552 [Rhizopogon vesiculosus]